MSQPDTPELGTSGDADALSLLLNRPDPTEAPAPEPEEEEDEQPAQDDTEQADDEPEQDDEQAEDDGEQDDPEEEWEAGGQKYKVKKSELRSGYMKDADYRRKTAEVAEQRRQVEAFAQQVVQERQERANQLDVFIGSLHKELLGSQPDPQLIDSDPQEFLRQQAAYTQRTRQFQEALQHRQSLQGRIDADTQRKQQEYAREEGQKLLEKLPGWRDDKTRAGESAQIAEYLSALGYSNDELAQLVDHRALLVALDAARYRAMQSAKDKKAPPVVGKSVKPGAARPASNSNQSRYQESLAKARKTGRPEDIHRVLMNKGT